MLMGLALLCACGNQSGDQAENEIKENDAAQNSITIEANGQRITIEDAEGKTALQLLNEAGIILNDGDVISVAPDQVLMGNMTIQVLRKYTVIVAVAAAAEDPLADIQYTAVLVGGMVADAIEAVGVKLTENQTANLELDKEHEDGMEIIISEKEEAENNTQVTDENSLSGSSDNNSSSNSGSGSDSSSGSSSGSDRTVVNVEIYEDCDGSGHGVKIIIYSDGSQEEVPF